MSASTERLDPPNEHAHFVLPPASQSASGSARSHDSVVAVYPQGISFIDELGAMEGFLTIIGGLGALLPIWAIYEEAIRGRLDWFFTGALLLCGLILRADTIAYRYQPVLFNRATGKVHCFVSEGITWWKLWQFKPASHIQTWDWSCIRGEVVEFTVIGGAGAPRRNYALICAVVDQPGSRKVVARFGVGMSYPWSADPMVERWEHLRRYMRNEGPPLAPGDALFHDSSLGGFWSSLLFLQPLFTPGAKEWWSGRVFGGAWWFSIPIGLAFVIIIWFTVPAGLLRWLSHVAKREPKWPAEILASVGGAALDAAALQVPKLTWTRQRKALSKEKQ